MNDYIVLGLSKDEVLIIEELLVSALRSGKLQLKEHNKVSEILHYIANVQLKVERENI